jgi:hypothetical protein
LVGILIVEDEPQLATYIQEVFTRAGYDRADIAASAAEALSLGACLRSRWSSGGESDSVLVYEQGISPLEDR